MITQNDLTANVLGINWGITRGWTGLNNSGPVGNGWSIAQLPYLVVAGQTNQTVSVTSPYPGFYPGDYHDDASAYDERISLVEGLNTFDFTLTPSYAYQPGAVDAYSTYPEYGAEGVVLRWIPPHGTTLGIMQLTDAAGDITDFNDVYRLARRQRQSAPGASSPAVMHKYTANSESYTAANGTTEMANYNAQNQLTSEAIQSPNAPGKRT